MSDGYRYEPEALRAVADSLRHGAQRMDEATADQIEAPDAGASSDIVARAMGELVRAAVGGSQKMDSIADNVDASRAATKTWRTTTQAS